MPVLLRKEEYFVPLEGKKLFQNGNWIQIPDAARVYFNNAWRFVGNVLSGHTISRNAYCACRVSSGWKFIDFTVTTKNGQMTIYPGGSAVGTIVVGNGKLSAYGTAKDTVINSNGNLYAVGGNVYDTVINYGGKMYVSSGNVYNTTINSGGYMEVRNLFGQSTQIASTITISSGGTLYIVNGSALQVNKLTGGVVISSGGTITYV